MEASWGLATEGGGSPNLGLKGQKEEEDLGERNVKEGPACSMGKREAEVCQQQGGKRKRERNSGHSAPSWQVCPEVSLEGHREVQEGWIQSG